MNGTQNEVYADVFEHSFDAKGRITVPSEWRSEAHEKRLHILPSQDGCLKVYPASFLSAKARALSEASIADPRRKSLERLAQIAQLAECDQQGRMMVKGHNREHASLGKSAVLVGCSDHFEIWDAAKWKQQQKEKPSTLEELFKEAGW